MKDPIGDRFQQETKYHRDKMEGGGLDWASKPPLYKRFADPEKSVSLPEPETTGGASLYDILRTRRSRRNFTGEPISLQTLSQLLWVTQGATAQAQQLLLRTAPSAGGLYPVETYFMANQVEGLEPGVYHLYLPEWTADAIRLGDYRSHMAGAALGQSMAAKCAVTFAFTIIPERSKWKYKQRGYRYMYLDAGHMGQNLSLAAEALGLGCCMIGAIFDDELNALLAVDGEEETSIYLGCVGSVEGM